MIVSINPATGREIARFESHSAAAVDSILSAAATAQANWRRRAIGERIKLLRRTAEVIRAGSDRYARLITAEMGKPLRESIAEVEKCALNCDFYADHAPGFLADEPVASNAFESAVVYDPLGVVLAIMPWNYPLWQFFRFAAPALAAGNGTVLKHASNVTGCALACEDIFLEAGAPDGLVRTVLIDGKEASALIADHRIAAVTMTGSTKIGAVVAAEAGIALKKQVLELGGSDPFIVLADADVEEAARMAVKARFLNCGQSCINAKRFFVEEAIADRFVESFVAAVAALKLGDPADLDTDLGPLARPDLCETLDGQVRRTISAGAKLRAGGARVDRPGFYYAPTLLDQVKPGMAAFDEETFGPVAAVVRVRDADEAVQLANQSEYGLGASLWTRDVVRARSLARQVEAGAVFINGLVASDPRLPFGGIKRSGYGRELGCHGIREFTNIKTLWIGPAKGPKADLAAARQLQGAILRPDEIKPHERGGGARTIPLVTRKIGSSGLLNGITEFAPGASIPLHRHDCEESVLVLEGEAIVEIGGATQRARANDTTWVPANVEHRFINASDRERMRIFWTYASLDATRTIVATGETRSIDSERT